MKTCNSLLSMVGIIAAIITTMETAALAENTGYFLSMKQKGHVREKDITDAITKTLHTIFTKYPELAQALRNVSDSRLFGPGDGWGKVMERLRSEDKSNARLANEINLIRMLLGQNPPTPVPMRDKTDPVQRSVEIIKDLD